MSEPRRRECSRSAAAPFTFEALIFAFAPYVLSAQQSATPPRALLAPRLGSLRLRSSDRGGGHPRQAAVWPARAASILAMSIRRMVIVASIARFAAARSGSFIAAIKARGTICQENP